MTSVVLNLMSATPVTQAPESPAAALRSSKNLALLCYLVLEPGAHLRDELATLLWGDSRDEAARASLRQALAQLRGVLGDRLHADRERVELTGEIECDVRRFLAACDQSPAAAVGFEVAQFMKHIPVPNAAGYQEWVDRTRAVLERRHVQALRAAMRDAMAASRWRDAIRLGTRWLEHEPFSDDAVRLVAESELMAGDTASALLRIDAHLEELRRAGSRNPNPALVALRRRIEATPPAHRSGNAPGTAPARSPGFAPRLVGREGQWRVLNAIWQEVADGHGQAVLLEGEVGAGKTRLADDWLRWIRAEGGTVLRGRGHDAAAPTPYGPIVEALRSAADAPGLGGTAPEYLAEVARLLPELRQRFPKLPAAGEPGDVAGRSRLFEGMAQLLLALADERPVVLLIDDVQWCDSETCAALHFLMERLTDAPVAVVLSVRLGDLDREAPAARLFRAMRARAGASVIELTPLPPAEVRELVAESGTIGTAEEIARIATGIHRATDGNPLHVIELIKMLTAGGAVDMDVDTGEWLARSDGGIAAAHVPLPGVVRDAIATRVAKLSDELRHCLTTVALMESPCSVALLSQVHGISRLHASALGEDLTERLLLRETDGRYTCAHPVIASVAAGMVSASRRVEVHRAIAMAIEAVTPDEAIGAAAAQIARHAELGRERAMTYYYALRAGQHEAGQGRVPQAEAWLDRAARFAEPGEEAAEIERARREVTTSKSEVRSQK